MDGKMREALENTDCAGMDDVICQASALYLTDDYKLKEVKDMEVMLSVVIYLSGIVVLHVLPV